MKRIFVVSLLFCATSIAFAQAKPNPVLPDYTFTTVKANPITSVKNQASSGTCWAFSTIGFFESEAIRLCGIKDTLKYPDFSDFYVVSKSYAERGTKYVMLDGAMGFSAGSESEDVLHVIRDWGVVPQSEMSGMNYGTALPAQAELDAVLKAYITAVVSKPNKTLTTAWKAGYQGIIDAYLGKCPDQFTVDGVQYTPASYRDAMKIDPDNYISMTSFTHHPFYTSFTMELCDNWRGDESYNIPIDELMAVIDNALDKGYTISWGADVSQPGFTRNGLAILLDTKAAKAAGSDQDHWVGKEEGKPAPVNVVELVPTQESRQTEYENKTLTDDHGMQIFGIAKDQNGKKYYMVKNSWGITGKYDGIWYATEAFVKGQTMAIMVNKAALPAKLLKQIGVK